MIKLVGILVVLMLVARVAAALPPALANLDAQVDTVRQVRLDRGVRGIGEALSRQVERVKMAAISPLTDCSFDFHHSPESGGGLAGRSSAGTEGGFAGEQWVQFPDQS